MYSIKIFLTSFFINFQLTSILFNLILYKYGLKPKSKQTRGSLLSNNQGRAIAQAVSRWLPTAAVQGSKPDLVMWDLWWDKVALGQVFSEFFGFPCNRRSLHQLLHNHPHISSGECTIGQCGRSAGTYRDLKHNRPLWIAVHGPNRPTPYTYI
jgi:hypothetical protein